MNQKITLEHRNFDNPTVNTDFNAEEIDSNVISKSLDTTVLKDQTAAKAEFIGTRFQTAVRMQGVLTVPIDPESPSERAGDSCKQ